MTKPIVIAHRGASGYLPEHTLEAASLAYAMGADYIEQDLVQSKDGALLVLHDIHLDTVTNIAEVFPHRARADGRFYALDFTLSEVKSLTVKERTKLDGSAVYPNRYKGGAHYSIATFEEQIELISNLNRQLNNNVGIYTEIKSPAWHRQQGYDISAATFAVLRKHALDDAHKNVFIQCFDFKENKRLRHKLKAKTKIIQLLAENSWNEADSDFEYLMTPDGLAEVAEIADGIGPWLAHIVDLATSQPTPLVSNAHQAGLQVHPYTFRKEELSGNTVDEVLTLLFKELSIDGLFTDYSDTVVQYLQAQRN